MKTIADLVREKLSTMSDDQIREMIGISNICELLGISSDIVFELAPEKTNWGGVFGDIKKFLELPANKLH